MCKMFSGLRDMGRLYDAPGERCSDIGVYDLASYLNILVRGVDDA